MSLAELMVVLALAGIAALAGFANWPAYKYRADITAAAKMAETSIHQARMYAVYRGVRHFVVFDKVGGTVAIHVDSNGNGVFDGVGTDLPVKTSAWPTVASLSLPPSSETMPDPTYPEHRTFDEAWDLPEPDASGVWGENLLGIMTTPTGQVMSTEAVPQVITNGTLVFSGNLEGKASSVSLNGGGIMKSYWYLEDSWRKL